MALPKWAAGTLYPPGSLVQPLSAQTPAINQPNNPSFETGTLEDWTYTTIGGAAVAAVQNSYAYSGTYGLYWPGGHGGGNEGGIEAFFQNSEQVFVTPGTQITGQCYIMYNPTSSPNGSQGRCLLYWFDEDHNQLGSPVPGTLIVGRGNNGKWRLSTVTGTAPENAVYACIGVWLTTVSGGCYADTFSWNYVQQAPSGLIYRAVQPAAGYSADTEPVWPLVNGEQVIDNEVIWEAVLTTRIVWQASPILVSGAVEPDFPESSGSFVADNTISWEAVSRRVEDPKCPNGKRVIIASSKIYGDDDDLVPYSATVNPLDWSSRDDAGYLPTNLQQYGSNPVAALGLYRGNVVPMNAEGMQVWQVDEDPAQSALLDAFPVGCEFHHSVASVSNDMFFLSSLGVRSVGIAGGATNLQAGDVGMPIDPLVQEAMASAQADEVDPLGLYNPNAGQYWLCFPEHDPAPPARKMYAGWIPYVYGVTFNGSSTSGGAGANLPSVKWSVGAYHPVKKVYQDVASIQWSNSTNNLYLYNLALEGNIVYSMMPYVWVAAENNIGIFAHRINYGTRELDPVAQWRIPDQAEENAYVCFGMSNGHLLVIHDNATTFTTMYSIKLEGNAFVLKDTRQIVTQHGDSYCCEAGDRVGVVVSTNGANVELVGLYSADAATGEITEHGLLPVPVGTVTKPRFGQPICYGDGYLYVQFNGDEFVPGLRVYNTAGGVLTEVLSELVPPGVSDNYGMTAGGGKVMQFDYTNDGDINVRTFDGTTMSPNIQIIPAWSNVKPYYDPVAGLLFSPNDTAAEYNFGGNILRWDEGSGQFVQDMGKFMLMPYNSDDTGYSQNFIQPFVTRAALSDAPDIVDGANDVYYVYMGNNALYQVGDYSVVKIAYGKYDLTTGSYTDLAMTNVMGASVWMQGGIAVNSGFIFAATGYDDTTVDIAKRLSGGAGLYVYEVDIDSNTLTELDRYIPAKISTDNSCITSPIVMDDGVVIVVESARNLVNSLDIVGFSFDGGFLTEVFRETLPVTDVTNSEQLLRYGEYILLGTYDGAYAFTYSAGAGITQVAFDAGGPDIVQLTASKAEVRGSYIITRTGTNGVRTWTFNGAAFTLVATLASVSGTGICVLEDGDDLIIGRDLDNSNNAFFNGFNRLQFYRFSGAVVTPLGIEIGHSPYQPLFVADNLLFVPYPSGIRYGGLVDNSAGTMGAGYVPTGVYSWDGDSLVTELPRFLLGHSVASSDFGQYGLRGFQTVPKLH